MSFFHIYFLFFHIYRNELSWLYIFIYRIEQMKREIYNKKKTLFEREIKFYHLGKCGYVVENLLKSVTNKFHIFKRFSNFSQIFFIFFLEKRFKFEYFYIEYCWIARQKYYSLVDKFSF